MSLPQKTKAFGVLPANNNPEPDNKTVETVVQPIEPEVKPTDKPEKKLAARMTVSLPPEVLENGKMLARMKGLNFSQYVCKLLEADAETDESKFLSRQNKKIQSYNDNKI